MTIFDFIVVTILGYCFLVSFNKGMIREVISFFGYFAGYFISINYYIQTTIWVQSVASQEIMARLIDFPVVFSVIKILCALVIFFLVKISFNMFGRLVRKSMGGGTFVSVPDKLVGGAFGALKGLVIVAILMFPLSLFHGAYEKVVYKSMLAPYLEKSIEFINHQSFSNKIIDSLPEISVDEIKKNLQQMSDLEKITQDFKSKKDELLKSVEGAVKSGKDEKILENYTEEDKDKLKDMLEKLSQK
jgi:membrane protein required for colicin V production